MINSIKSKRHTLATKLPKNNCGFHETFIYIHTNPTAPPLFSLKMETLRFVYISVEIV